MASEEDSYTIDMIREVADEDFRKIRNHIATARIRFSEAQNYSGVSFVSEYPRSVNVPESIEEPLPSPSLTPALEEVERKWLAACAAINNALPHYTLRIDGAADRLRKNADNYEDDEIEISNYFKKLDDLI